MLPKKIPTLLALFILFFSIGIISIVIQKATSGKPSASASQAPVNLMVTNITDTSCKIIWETSATVTGMVTLTAPNKTTVTAYDERDLAGKLTPYATHSVLVKNLTPNTTYTIAIMANGKPVTPKDKPFTVTTGPGINDTTVSGFEPSYGTVKTSDGKPASGGIVVLSLENSQSVSTLITPSGSWIIPLNFIRTKDLSRYLPYSEAAVESITVYYGSQKTDAITTINNDSPVPDMTVGGSYDFRNQSKGKASSSVASNSTKTPNARSLLAQRNQGSVLGTTTGKTGQISVGGVSISSPTNNSSITSTRPLIQGTGIPGKTLSISVGMAHPQTGKTSVKANGVWQYTPPRPLSFGKQNTTITTVDRNGKTVVLTSVFTVLKAGSQVLGDATPSATTTVSATETATMTPTPTIEDTITLEPMPEPGGSVPTILLIVFAVGLVAGGAFFLL